MLSFKEFLNEKENKETKVEVRLRISPRADSITVSFIGGYGIDEDIAKLSEKSNFGSKVKGLIDNDSIVSSLIKDLEKIGIKNFTKDRYPNEKSSGGFILTSDISKKIEGVLRENLKETEGLKLLLYSVTKVRKEIIELVKETEERDERSRKERENSPERKWFNSLSPEEKQAASRGYLKYNHKGPVYTGD